MSQFYFATQSCSLVLLLVIKERANLFKELLGNSKELSRRATFTQLAFEA